MDGNRKLWTDEDGVIYVGVIPFLLEDIIVDIAKWNNKCFNAIASVAAYMRNTESIILQE